MNTVSNENRGIATELLQEIVTAADAGSALMLGPQAVKNLRAMLTDVLTIAASAPETGNSQTTDAKLAELRAQCQDLWRTDITIVCRLPKGHAGDHRGGNGWTWNRDIASEQQR